MDVIASGRGDEAQLSSIWLLFGPQGLCRWHKTVNHSKGEYVSRTSGATVNGLEGFWAQLKRGINGTHIHVSPKHLPKYLGEFEFRHNRRDRPETMIGELMVSFPR